jgi:hypothetical protein
MTAGHRKEVRMAGNLYSGDILSYTVLKPSRIRKHVNFSSASIQV